MRRAPDQPLGFSVLGSDFERLFGSPASFAGTVAFGDASADGG
jgi:hypothetical protein